MVKSRIYFASRDVSVSLVSAFSPPHIPPQTSPYQVLAFWRQLPVEQQGSVTDLVVLLPGDVPADHVIEEHPQGPHSCWPPKI